MKLFTVDVPQVKGDNARQFSEGSPPKICEGEKKRPKFDFDRECLRNGSTYRKSEKTVINYNLFRVGPKKW